MATEARPRMQETEEEFENETEDVKDDLLELGRLARATLQQNMRGVKGRMNEAMSRAREKAGEVRDSVANRVQEHPLQTLLIAAGVGALVAILLRNSRK